ncbi:MAG: hypothetical protein IJK49_00580 [Prevotella sp.]|nr:hypothetical protein [Prevotella sp.]
MKKIGFCFLLCIIISGCFPEVEELYLSNDSSKRICAIHTAFDRDRVFGDTLLPKDTIRNPERNSIWLVENNAVDIEPFSEKVIDGEFIINHIPDTFYIFIIDPDTIDKYTWDGVRKENNIIARYNVTLGFLKRNNFKVKYPPSLWMKELKMYPSYDEIIRKVNDE